MRTFLLLGGYFAGASLLWLAMTPGRAPFGGAAPEAAESLEGTQGRRLAEAEASNSEAMPPPTVTSHLRKVIPANATFESKVTQGTFLPGNDGYIACVSYGYAVMMTPCCARCSKKRATECARDGQQVLGGGTVPFPSGTTCPQALVEFNRDPGAYVPAGQNSQTIFGLEPWQFSLISRILTQLVYGAIYFFCIMTRYPYFMGPSEASARLEMENEVCATAQTRCPICCLSMFCSGPRAAHTFAATGTCGYWPSLILMSICPCPVLWWANSCTDLNVKLGARKRKDPCTGAACAWCCSCCVIAQDAEALDLATGAQTGFCGVDPPPLEMQQMQAQMQQGYDPYYQQGQYPPPGYPPSPSPYQQPYQQQAPYGQYPGYAMPYGQEMPMQGQGSLCCCSASPPVPPMPQPAPYRPAYSAAY